MGRAGNYVGNNIHCIITITIILYEIAAETLKFRLWLRVSAAVMALP